MAASTRIGKWLDERYQLRDLIEFAEHKIVPVHHESLWYYFGGVTLFLFLIQVATGILLMLYYKPGIETAYESVRFILTDVEFGWLIRSVHSWSANLMIFFAFIHMFSVFFTRAYRNPRELTWVGGILTLVIALGFGFSGYLLPWNELSYFATAVGTDIVGAVPLIGEPMLKLLRSGDEVTGATLHRFFGIHVAIMPGMAILLIGLHLLFVQRQGMSAPVAWERAEPSRRRSLRFFPNFILRDALLWLIVLNVIAILAVVAPFGIGMLEWPLGEKADPFAPAPEGIRPEWYFMFMFQTLKQLPAHIGPFEGEMVGVLGFGLLGIIWLLVPFWDHPRADGRLRGWTIWVGVIALAYIIGMTLWGYLA